MSVQQARNALKVAVDNATKPNLSADVQRARDKVVAEMQRKLELAEAQARKDLARTGR